MGELKKYLFEKFHYLYPFQNQYPMSKISIVMEMIWLVLSGFCLILGIYATVNSGFSTSYMFFVLAVVALLMFFFRRYKRIGNASENKN
jgi:Ca2+/Na+ antiporter